MIGREQSLWEHLDNLVDIFREVRRVLRPDGTVWIVYGDAYAGSGRGGTPEESPYRKQATNKGSLIAPSPLSGFKPKDLMLMPSRLAIALWEDDWYIRDKGIWHKHNAMPQNVTDRPTSTYEEVLMISKSPRYFYDATSVRTPITDQSRARGRSTDRKPRRASETNGYTGIGRAVYETANLRNVWKIATKGYSGSHHATYPPALILPFVIASTSSFGVCPTCGSPWTPVVARTPGKLSAPGPKAAAGMEARGGNTGHNSSIGRAGAQREYATFEIADWHASCECGWGQDPIPAKVLDPFAGAGTTGLVALQHGRSATLLEISPEYAVMAKNRIDTAEHAGRETRIW